MVFPNSHFSTPLRIAIGAIIAVVGLSACETSSLYENRYARYYDACDQRAGICYANCSDFPEGESKTECQSACTSQVDQCFADISARIQADNDQRYAYTPTPYYGAYGYYRPGYGYSYGPYNAPYGYYANRSRTYPYFYSYSDYGYYDPRYNDYYNRRYYGYDRGRGDGRGDGGYDQGGTDQPDYDDRNDSGDRFYDGRVVKPGVAARQSEIDARQRPQPSQQNRTFDAPTAPEPRSSTPPQKVTKPGTRPKNDD
ncbi:hypothetical protein [Aquisalinus flavus]|uniref:Uncharacterized protein n=1 Tax=Aquisalinus flavus TaxID=1526572 RepID=A0A8J2V4S4_9PROT|nr:hypothetical protein [Aquisalinus flavus]MBD0427780.1 hypothetical protein [Aquisalinus flavus]UNE47554.1 hypothetical protein FF099_05525 [Aquisalinus flavus]GGD03780.1 hypothetical protein GCM10011342_10950 [Aquisalinus flavus]